jgi:X-Pro dipeptidyl-peptidase (S15 family)
MRCGRALISVVTFAVGLGLGAAPASAAITSVFGGETVSGNPIPCVTQSDGTRVCHGTYNNGPGGSDIRLKGFDGAPLAVYVTLPPAPSSGTDGNYPLVVQSHGWGGPTSGPSDTQYYGPTGNSWANSGYAVLQLHARGWGDSCGSAASRQADTAACANGYIRLDDQRYEARDVQNAVGLLVDELAVNPAQVGLTGESYGGGVSLELATLNNRVMNPDGSISRWVSPGGTALHIAFAAPVIPWSDLDYSLLPNGRMLDTAITSPTADLSPFGVEKQSFVSGLFATAPPNGSYSPPGTNPQADLTTWFATINAGEPYDTNSEDQFIQDQIARYHSPYYLLDNAYGTGRVRPAPLLIANGFADDLFPVDEAVRYYNLDRSLYPGNPVALFDGDFGHQRAQNKADVKALLSSTIKSFFDFYVRGLGTQPQLGATAMTETCPSSAPSGGPFTAPSWSKLHRNTVSFSSTTSQTILSTAGDPLIAKTVDPVAGGGACATATATDQGAGVATYRLPAATGNGYTLLGAPSITANFNVSGQFAFVAARLWDVDPSTNTETLVSRGVYRINGNAPNGQQTFQLHPGGWTFAAGHVPKLELLGQDPPYVRTSNGTFSIQVSSLSLSLPVN